MSNVMGAVRLRSAAMALHAIPEEDAGDRASSDCRPLLNSSERMLLFYNQLYEQRSTT
jgi:hypothetical protein